MSLCKRCCKGKISSKPQNPDKEEELLGEYFDVKCVIAKCKPLAALDMSKKLISKKRKHNFSFEKINQVITDANKNKIVAVQKSNTRIYLNTIFCSRRNINKAYKLLNVIHNPMNLTQKEYHFLIGTLLGYSKENIMYFLERNNFGPISKEEIKIALTKMKSMEIDKNDPTITVIEPIPLFV